jgi:hypothetical protein
MLATAMSALFVSAHAYEINNHADISQEAGNKSALARLSTDSRKLPLLERLGLKSFPAAFNDPRQTFPFHRPWRRQPQPWADTVLLQLCAA